MNEKALSTFYGHLQEQVPAFKKMELSQFEQEISDPQKLTKFYQNLQKQVPSFQKMEEADFRRMIGYDEQPAEEQQVAEQSQAPKRQTSWMAGFPEVGITMQGEQLTQQEQAAAEKQQQDAEAQRDAELHERFRTKQPQAEPVNPLARGPIQNNVDFSRRLGIQQKPAEKLPTMGEMKEQMQQMRQEHAQEVHDRRYQNKDGKPKDSYMKDLFESWQAGVGEIALAPFKAIEAAEDFGMDIENKIRGTHFQHGTGTATRFFNKVFGIDYLRSQVEHYGKEADRYQDGKGITETALEGDLGTAAGKAVLSTIQSAPNLAVSIYSGKKGLETLGGVFLGTTAALQKYDEIKDREDIDNADKALAMFGAFVSECVPEIIGAKRYGKMFNQKTVGTLRKETQKEVMNAWQKFVNSNTVKNAGRAWDWFMKYFGEGTTEAMTDVMNLGIDLALGIKDGVTKKDLMNIGDSFIVGQLSDAMPSGVHFYQQKSYEHSVKKEIEASPMLMHVTQKLDATPDEIANIASKVVYQENISDKEEKLFNEYQQSIADEATAIHNIDYLIHKAGLTRNSNAYAAYLYAVVKTGISEEDVNNLLSKDRKDLSNDENEVLNRLVENMKEGAAAQQSPTEETTVSSQTQEVQPTEQPTVEEPHVERPVLSTGTKPLEFTIKVKEESRESGKTSEITKDVKVSFQSQSYTLAEDGAIESDAYSILVNGKPLTGNKKREYLGLINDQLREEKVKKDEAAEAARLEEERKETEEYQRQQHIAEMQAQLEQQKAEMRENVKGVTRKNGEINLNEATPEQVVFFLLEHNGDNRSVAEKSTVDIATSRIVELHAEKEKKGNAIEKWQIQNKIDGYYAAIRKWIGQDAEDAARAAVNQSLGIETEPQQPAQSTAPAQSAKPAKQEPKKENKQEPAAEKLEARSNKIYDHIKVTEEEKDGVKYTVYTPYAKTEGAEEATPVENAGVFVNSNTVSSTEVSERKNDIADIQVLRVHEGKLEEGDQTRLLADVIYTYKDGRTMTDTNVVLKEMPKITKNYREKPDKPDTPLMEEPATDALRPFDENGNRIEDVVLIRRKSRAEYKLAKKSEIPDKWREAKSQRVVYVGADRTPALIRVEQEKFGKEVPVYLSNGKQAVVPVQDVLVKDENGNFVSFTKSDWYSVHEVGTPKSFEEIKNHVIFQRFTFGDLLNMGYEAFYTAVDKETGKGIPSSVTDDIHRAIVLWNRYVAGAAQKSKSIAALKPEDLAHYRAMQYAILKSDRSAAAAAHDMTRLAQIEERLNSIVLQVAMISSNTAGKATDAVLKKATWENPLNRLVVAMELAQKLGYLQESELPDMQLPEELEKEASMDVITSAELEKMREQYNADKAAGKGLAQYDNFPELAREGQLVSRYRFVMRKKKGGGEAEVNGYDDVKGIYKNIDEAADVTKTTEQAAKEYEEFLKMLSDAYQAYQQGNGKLLSKINKNIATAIKAHPKDANYTLALARMNGKIAQEEAAKYPALVQSVILHQEIAEIEQKIQSVNDDIAAEEKKAEEEKREPKRLAVAQMLPSFREQLAAKTAELDALNEQNPDLDAAYQEYVQTERPQQGVVIAFPTKEQRGVNYSTWTPVEVDRKAVNQQIDELTKQHEALQEELKNTKQRARQNELKAQMNDLANQIADLRKSLVRPKVQLQTGENIPMAEFTETEKKSKQARLAYNALVAALQRVKGLNLHMVGSQEEARRVLEMIQGNPMLMSVFHGSGAVFDRFDLSHVGEGEGSQAYGFGTYVSNQRGTANYYAKIASKNTRVQYNGNALKYTEDIPGVTPEEVDILDDLFSGISTKLMNGELVEDIDVLQFVSSYVNEAKEELNNDTIDSEYKKELYDKILVLDKFLNKLKGNSLIIKAKADGYVYSVEIPDDNGKNYLDWNKPMTREEAYEFVEQFKKYYPFINKVTGFSKGDFEEIKEKIDYNIDTYGHISFGVLYRNLGWLISPKINNRTLNFDKLASEALRKLGYTGIKVPVKNLSGGSYNVDGTNYIIFDENDLTITGREKIEFFKAPDGTIYGWSIGNDMYLTNEGLNPETPIHEYTHIWLNALKVGNKAAYDKVLRAIKARKGLWEKVTKDPAYAHLTTDEEIASEVLARYSGKRGAARLMELANELYGQNLNAEPTTLTKTFIGKMQSILKEFWDAVKGLFGIQSMDDISDWVLKDLFDGKPLDFNTEEMQAIKDKAVADGTFMQTPDGRPTKLTEKQWLQVRTKAFKEWYGDWENPKEGEFFLLDGNEYVRDPESGEMTYKLAGEPLVVYHGSDRSGFDIFDPKDIEYRDGQEISRSNGRGIFLTSHRPVASVYTTKNGNPDITNDEALIGDDPHHGIYSLYNNMHNPLIIDCSDEKGNPSMYWAVPTGQYKVVGADMPTMYFDSYDEAAQWMYDNGFGLGNNEEEFEPEIVPDVYTTDQFVAMAQGQGYDGVIFLNILDGGESTKLFANDNEAYMQGHDVVVAFAPNQVKSATQNNGLFSMEDARIEYQYTDAQLKELDEPTEKRIRKEEDKGTERMLDPDMSDQERESWWESVVTRIADQSNGMRLMLNSINAYRKLQGLEPLNMDKYDVRTKFEACRSIIANKVGFLERGIQMELDDTVREFADIVENSQFYKKYMKEVGGEKPTVLSPVQIIERYLMARNNWERAKEGVARGLAEFKERMGYTDENGAVHHVGVIEFANEFKDAFGEKAVLNLWDKVRAMTDFALDTNFEGGMISEELYQELKAKKFYVPQRGFWDDVNPENEEEGKEDLLQRRQRGNSIARNKLDSMHKAEGGKSLAEGCLAYIARDARQAIKLSEENKVKKVMFDLLRDNEDWCHLPEHNFKVPRQVYYETNEEGNIVRMDDGPTEEQRKLMNQLKGIIKELKAQYQTAETDEEREAIQEEIYATEAQFPYFDEKDSYRILHTRAKTNKALVGLYINGVPCEIEMTPRFIQTADALNGRRDKRGEISALKTVTSWLSAQFTMNNPTFFAVNITRDTPLILTKGAVEYGPEFSARFTANWAVSQKAIWTYLLTGKIDNTDIGAQLRDFLMNGGNTGYSNLEELERWRRRVSDLNPGGSQSISEIADKLSTVKGAKELGVDLLKGTLKIGDKAIGWAELRRLAKVLNEWSEIISRFSAYKSVVDMGLGVNEGIKAAHNLSTNFNRRGLGAPFINFFNSLTVFANAGIQGASGYWRTLDAQGGAGEKAKKIAKTAAYMGMLPAFLGFVATMFNPDDDEYEYMVSEYERDNYIVLGDKRLALNEQLKPWWVIGVNAALLCRGKRTLKQASNSVLTSMFTNWLPLPQNLTGSINMLTENITGKEEWNIAQIARQAIMPSAMQTMNQWADNKNFLGGKLRYDIGDIPEYEMAPNEAALYRDLAKVFYAWGGGNELVPSKTKEDGSKIRRWWDVNPKEIKSNTFWIPSGALDNFCLAYGLAKDTKERIEGDYHGTNVRVKDLPVINRFYKPSDKTLYRYAVVREARDIVQRHDDRINNLEKQVKHFSDVYAKTGTEEAKASLDEAKRLLSEEKHDVTATKMKKVLDKYNKKSIRALQNKLGESNKELKLYHEGAVDKLDDTEYKLVQMLTEGVNLKTGLRHSTDVPEWIQWFDDHSGQRQDRRE